MVDEPTGQEDIDDDHPSNWIIPTDESNIGSDTPDSFGHTRYVDALEQLITSSPSGQTIGLLGGYGTGKTWITKQLNKRLSDRTTPDFGTVDYDAWRYAEDEIRRDFLVHLKTEMINRKIASEDKMPKIDEDTFTVDFKNLEEERKTITFKAIGLAMLESFRIGIVLVALGAFAGSVTGLIINEYPNGLWFGVTGILVGFGWFVQNARRGLDVNRLTVRRVRETHRPPVELPEGFLALFNKIVSARCTDRLLITIDNIDRCSPDVALKVLSTVKNFLEAEDDGVFFLITCNAEALQRHLSAAFQVRGLKKPDADEDANEYIGKFFSGSIKIAEFDTSELLTIAKSDLKKSLISEECSDVELERIARIATIAKRKSPRELKVLLNEVISSFLVLKNSHRAEVDGLTPADLAKLCALRDKAPTLWRAIQDDPMALVQIETRDDTLTTPIDSNDLISQTLADEEQKRVVKALQWHPISTKQVRLFLGLRTPLQADEIVGYDEFQYAVDEADTATAISIAQESDEMGRSNLLNITGERASSRTATQTGWALNPTLVGLSLLANFEFANRDQSSFLSMIQAGHVKTSFRRLTPDEIRRVCISTKTLSGSAMLRRAVLEIFCDDSESTSRELVSTLNEVLPLCADHENVGFRQIIDAALIKEIEFESRLSRLSTEVKTQLMSHGSIQLLAKSFTLPAGPDGELNYSSDLNRLKNYPGMLHESAVREILQASEEYLGMRQRTERAVEDTDMRLVYDVVSLIHGSQDDLVDAFGPTLGLWLDQMNANSYHTISGMASDIEPLATGELQRIFVRLVLTLIGPGDFMSNEEGRNLAIQACSQFSLTSSRELLAEVLSQMNSDGDRKLIELAMILSRNSRDWIGLNESATARSESSLTEFVQFLEACEKFSAEEISNVFKRSIKGLIDYLENDSDFVRAGKTLINLSSLWSDSESESVVEKSIPRLTHRDPGIIEQSSTLINEAGKKLRPPKMQVAHEKAVRALVDGPSDFEGPQVRFNLQLDSLEFVDYNLSLEVRRMIIRELIALESNPHRLISLATRLVKVHPKSHSNELLQPAVDYALTTGNDDWRQIVIEFINILEPDFSFMGNIRQPLQELDAKVRLLGSCREFLDGLLAQSN